MRLVTYGLISNNHAGERRVIVQETPVRVVCSNTLGMALTRSGVADTAQLPIPRCLSGGGNSRLAQSRKVQPYAY